MQSYIKQNHKKLHTIVHVFAKIVSFQSILKQFPISSFQYNQWQNFVFGDF